DYLNLVGVRTIIYKLRNGIIFAIRTRTNDKTLFNQVWLKQNYLPRGFEIKKSDLIIDIGAHIGFFSILAAAQAKEGRVYSFEPAPENFKMFRENIKANGIQNILPFNEAVADKVGERDFILYSKSTGAHSFIYSKTDEKNIIKVKTVSLDEFVKKNGISSIDFLKMDCEGAEYGILFNCLPETLKKIGKISMEYHNMDEERNVNRLKTFLERNGFVVNVASFGDSMLYAARV
ncbi:MAG: FkbM family methyltransferase, partial [Patescibacteria group bacterium]